MLSLKPLRADNAPQSLPALPQYPALGDSYHFSPPAPTSSSHSRDFYRVSRYSFPAQNIVCRVESSALLRLFNFFRLMMSSRHISPACLYGVSFVSRLQGLLLRSVSTATLPVNSHQRRDFLLSV